ncbi:glycoside hydrolase family 43 protein [Flavobacterium cellulosilyticum]|uniref:Beta-glucanase n=1 Tax=Flavobacterium cellulosilyticum TaxID=2541731 RepID=A0A4R5C9Y6_9FLAO|nr:glycoside hydrolase family 43 protein [Flavobacterium cellulosilyticum]TDD93832.1 beta-glucanase [Flavobacterium cellulosilyticum]
MFEFYKIKKASLFGISLIVCLFCIQCNVNKIGKNKIFFVPGKKWLDTRGVHINAHGGGVWFNKGIYYWYGEHKTSGSAGNTSLFGVTCYSSKDLNHWKNEGIVLKVQENANSEITKGCVIERPKVVYNKKTGKYVMWFHLELKNQGYDAARTGVAVSDSPQGPFDFIKSYRPNVGIWPMNFEEKFKLPSVDENELKSWTPEWLTAVKNGTFIQRDFNKGQMARDITVFVDTDGKAYHIHSSEDNLSLDISELTADYLDFTNNWNVVAPAGHNEAPAIFKKNDIYYMITSGCTGWDPNEARSFSSKSIWGPWKSLGNPCIGKDASLTFHSQGTYVLPVEGKKDQFIFMADRWNPNNPIEGTYVWLPIQFDGQKPIVKWFDKWNLKSIDDNYK